MTVTAKKGKADKTHIYIDGEYRFTVQDAFWLESGFSGGDTVTGEKLASFEREAGFHSACQNGIRLLSAREHGKRELYMKLVRKHGSENAQRAVDELERSGLIDDAAYAARFCEYLYNRKKWDKGRIRLELTSKGIDRDIIEETLEQGIDNDPVSRIIILLNTKFSGSLSDEKGKRRVFSALLRMGYQKADIFKAFSQSDTVFENGYGDNS